MLEDGVVRGQRVRVSLSTRLGWRKGRWRVSVCWEATRYLAGGRREVAARRVELAWEEKGEVEVLWRARGEAGGITRVSRSERAV